MMELFAWPFPLLNYIL